jgi:GNAT superfamily N-acetyltransferase
MTMPDIRLRPLTAADATVISQAFAALGWPGKTVEQFQRYLAEQAADRRAVIVAYAGDAFAGYLTVRWITEYAPFREQGIPEIQDLNVLPPFRRRRIATALMDAAEALIADRADTAGLGVGLYADYGPAHLMYLRRGYPPDGRGLAVRGVTVAPGGLVRVDDDLTLMMTRRLPG